MTIEKHMDKFFTEYGFETLYSYTQTLVKEYYERKNYPFQFGVILGIPFHKGSSAERIIDSKEELKGRIKAHLQLMCIKSITIHRGNAELTFEVKQ